MHDRSLQDVRRKFVRLMRADPPPAPALEADRPVGARLFERWMLARFSPEEVQAIVRLEREYGEEALGEWFAEIALEAGLRPVTTH